MEENLLHAARAKWDDEDVAQARSVAWLSLPQIVADIQRHFSGDLPMTDFVRRTLAQTGRTENLTGAALVCGDMNGERMFFEGHSDVSFRAVDGYDISAKSMDRYEPGGLTFNAHEIDCNRLDLPVGRYDLIVALHGIHHVFNLGNLFYVANRSLRPGGLMFMYEWMGPEFLQLPQRNRWIAAQVLERLFTERERTDHHGRIKGQCFMQESPDQFDPSEACNSSQLWPQFLRHFEPISSYLHGGLAYPMFEGIAQNFPQKGKATDRRVKRVIALESLLTRSGLIRPLFALSLGRKRLDVF